MTSEDLSRLPDGATLRRLPCDLEIVRRRKHEPIDVSRLSRSERAARTDKRHGSKFGLAWTLERLTDWIAERVEEYGWVPGRRQKLDVPFEEPVGYSVGTSVRTIRIMSDGRYVHAFPVED